MSEEHSIQDRRAFALAQLDRVQSFIPRAESKVTAILPLTVAMLGIVAYKIPVKDACSWRFATGAIAALCLAVCLLRIYETMFPRLMAPRGSLIFFGEIAKRGEADYVTGLKVATEEQLIEDAASQIWRNSEIVNVKFAKAKSAFHWLALAGAPWVAFLVLVTLTEGKFPGPGAG